MALNKLAVIYFPQANFIRHLENPNIPQMGQLELKSFDKDTVFHVIFSEKPSNWPAKAVYLKKEELPQNDELEVTSKHLLAAAPPCHPRVAVFFGQKTKSLQAYVIKSNSEIAEEADIVGPPTESLFHSRSIIETQILKTKSVCIIGLGSGGSQTAIELAKAGVGRFVLIDFDRLEFTNVARHACSLQDVGRLKTNAMKDLLQDRNLEAQIETVNADINEVPYRQTEILDLIKTCDLIIGATDTIRSRRNINVIAIQSGLTTIFGKCSVRAAGGDVLVVRPTEGPCLACVYGAVSLTGDEASNFRRSRNDIPAYVSDSDVEATIQVGLSSDIMPISNMVTKIALVELSRGTSSGLETLEGELGDSLFRWANRREQEFSSYPEKGFERYDKPSILRWYPVSLPRDPDCWICGEAEELASV